MSKKVAATLKSSEHTRIESLLNCHSVYKDTTGSPGSLERSDYNSLSGITSQQALLTVPNEHETVYKFKHENHPARQMHRTM